MLLSIMDCDPTADNEKGIAVYYDCCAFINADTKQLWVRRDDGIKVGLATACIDVLVDSRIGEQTETSLMPRRHHYRVVTVGISSSTRRTPN